MSNPMTNVVQYVSGFTKTHFHIKDKIWLAVMSNKQIFYSITKLRLMNYQLLLLTLTLTANNKRNTLISIYHMYKSQRFPKMLSRPVIHMVVRFTFIYAISVCHHKVCELNYLPVTR